MLLSNKFTIHAEATKEFSERTEVHISCLFIYLWCQLPQRSVDAIAIKQQLLSQYDMLQSRIKDLKEAAEKEVWMLARMCQLENKIYAVGEPSYR
ncbi:hypothetical protein Pint_14920 [Pistacia integerrima]|nr:hypothetical protein Pint_14920 [Pistacia integerrima]